MNNNSSFEQHAFKCSPAYMCFASEAHDGTVFVPSPVAEVASGSLAICVIDKDGTLIKVHSDKLYANIELAKAKAQELCDSYNQAHISDVVKEVVDREYGRISKSINGQLVYDIYADYDDKLSDNQATKIVSSDDPWLSFEELLEEAYREEQWRHEDELIDKIHEEFDSRYPDGFEVDDEEIRECMMEYIYFDLPRDHYLDQEFYVDIMLDTGDGNYDFVLNSAISPCYYGSDETIPDKASLLWLAKQQGYKKSEFKKAMSEGDISHPHGFLESVRQELANLPSRIATLTFLVKMKLRDLIKLNRLIRLQDREGKNYDATKNPYCGYIILDKKTETGLFNSWDGGGSVFEIELEKDVRIPIRFIYSALPDGGVKRYSVGEVYGMCCSVWRDTVKDIHEPMNFSD